MDPLTILCTLGVTVVKAAQDTDNPWLPAQVLDSLLSGVTGNLLHEDVRRLSRSLAEWIRKARPAANEELQRAVTRSAVCADLFCLMEALGELSAERLGWLPENLKNLRRPIKGFFETGTEAQLRKAEGACERRLKEIENNFNPVDIDPARLLRELDASSDYAQARAAEALKAVEAGCGALPESVREIFNRNWYAYLCGAFHHEIKTNEPVFRIFLTMGQQAGFDRIERAVRDEAQKLHDHIDRAIAPRPAAFTYALPELGLFVGRQEEREIALERWFSDRNRPLLIWGGPGIGKSKLALGLLHHPQVVKRFGPRRYRLRCDPHTTANAMIAAMGVEWFGLEANPAIAGQVINKLSDAPTAIVVDNFETTHRADPGASEEWLEKLLGVPELWLIVGLQGRYQPGKVNWVEPVEPGLFSLEVARELFCSITKNEAHRRDPRLESLLTDMEGIPHAIELLAHQAVGASNLAEIAERWAEERTGLLERMGGRTREMSIAVAYEFAIQSPMVSPAALRLLRILANLPAGMAEPDVPKLMERLGGIGPLRAKAALKQAALVYEEDGRVKMLAPLRDHVLRAHPATTAELGPAILHFVALATGGENVGYEGGGRFLHDLTSEYPNIDWAITMELESKVQSV